MGIFDKLFGKKEEKSGGYSEVFNRLCDDDVTLIKNKDLIILTPSLAAFFVMSLLRDDDIRKLGDERLKKTQQFNLLVFYSFCYFYCVRSSAKMKRGHEPAITEMLRAAFLQGVVALYNAKVKNPPSSKVLNERGRVLYADFEAAADKYGFREGEGLSAQLEVSDAFASAVFADDRPNVIRGMLLYVYFVNISYHLIDEFLKWFLVEEEDFDEARRAACLAEIRAAQMVSRRRGGF